MASCGWKHLLHVVTLLICVVVLQIVSYLLYRRHDIPSPDKDSIDGRLPSVQKSCAFTISAWNNYGFVSTLYDSILENSPSVGCFFWFIGDSTQSDSRISMILEKLTASKSLTLVTLEQLESVLPNFDSKNLAFKFDMVEFQTTIKPFAFQYLFKVHLLDSAIFLDNDIWVTGSLKEVQRLLLYRSVIVTPHYTSPVAEDGKRQRDIDILTSGVFNFGFIAVSNTESAWSFLTWWSERLVLYGYVDKANGMHFDQNWGMFIPVLIDHGDYMVIRDIRYNVAYWNLHTTGSSLHIHNGLPFLTDPDSQIDKPVIFMHFSGMSLLEQFNLEGISRHQNRFTIHDFPRLEPIFEAYSDMLRKHDALMYRQIPYGYDTYSDNSKINSMTRRIYGSLTFPVYPDAVRDRGAPFGNYRSPSLRVSFSATVHRDPFCASPRCQLDSNKILLIDWLTSKSLANLVDMEGMFFFSAVEASIWESRLDLQSVFPNPTGSSYYTYKEWFFSNSLKESLISKTLYDKWLSSWQFHVENHSKFHRQVVGTNDLGVNVFGCFLDSCPDSPPAAAFVDALKSVAIQFTALEASDGAESRTFSGTTFSTSRSCFEPVNLFILNAEGVWKMRREISEVIWQSKYNIGFWTWDVSEFSESLVHVLSDYDEVWCATEQVKLSLQNKMRKDGATLLRVLAMPLTTPSNSLLEYISVSSTPHMAVPLTHPKSKWWPLPGWIQPDSKPFVYFTDAGNAENIQLCDQINSLIIRAFHEAFPQNASDSDQVMLYFKIPHRNHFEATISHMSDGDVRIATLPAMPQAFIDPEHACYISLASSDSSRTNMAELFHAGVPSITIDHGINNDLTEALSSFRQKCIFVVPHKKFPSEAASSFSKVWAKADDKALSSTMKSVQGNNCHQLERQLAYRRFVADYGNVATGALLKEFLLTSFRRIKKKNASILNPPQHLKEQYWP